MEELLAPELQGSGGSSLPGYAAGGAQVARRVGPGTKASASPTQEHPPRSTAALTRIQARNLGF